MALYVYCNRKSAGALALTTELGATRLRGYDGLNFWNKSSQFQLNPEDVIICWGSTLPDLEGVRVLNAQPYPSTRFDDLTALRKAGLYAITPFEEIPRRTLLLPEHHTHHGSGYNVVILPGMPNWLTIWDEFTKQYRLHSFAGKSIKAGVKVPRPGFTIVREDEWQPDMNMAHPWARSWYGGWHVDYESGFKSTAAMKRTAHAAITALGLTFGAVDMAENNYGDLKILRVSKAPRLEGTSLLKYVTAIKKWIAREEVPE